MRRAVLAALAAVLLMAAPASAAGGTARLAVKWTNQSSVGFDLDTGTKVGYGDVNAAIPCDDCAPLLVGTVKAMDALPPKASCLRVAFWDTYAAAPEPRWLCVRTSEGRYARLRVTHWPTKAERWLTFRWRTWP